MQLVLHGGEEVSSERRLRIVVGGSSVEVGDLLVEAALARPDLSDALEQLFEVVLPEECLAPLQSLVVEGEALDDELAEDLVAQMRNCVAW